jgi:hypothetical protein
MIRARHVLLSAVLAAGPLGAQGPDTLVVAGDTVARAAAVRTHGYAAYPVSLLAALGAEVAAEGERVEVKLFGVVLWFRPGYSTFAVNGRITPLDQAMFERAGVLYLPEVFFLSWLRGRYGERLRYDAATGTLALTPPWVARAEPRPVAPASRPQAPPPPRPAPAPVTAEEPTSPPTDAFEDQNRTRRNVPAVAELYFRLSGSYADNFFQAPRDGVPIELLASTAEARMVIRITNPRMNVRALVNGTTFDGFAPSVGALGGFDWVSGRHSAEASAGYQRRSPRLNAGDRTGFASIVHGTGTYGFRFPGEIQVNALGHYYDVYLHSQAAESRFYGGGGALRYRGFGYRFSPEVGGTYSRWDGPTTTENYDERMGWVSLRAAPSAALYLHVRYRYGLRTYLIDDAAANNFARADTRRHVTVAADVRLLPRLVWGVYYTYEDVVSTRTDRSFAAHSVMSGLSYRVW